MSISPYVILLIAIVIGVVGQLLFKHGMSRHPGFRIRNFLKLIRDCPIVGGFCCYVVATLLYFKVLATLELSVAYPTVSLGYVIVIIMSRLLFNEQISPIRWIAVITICTGVALVGLTAR